MVQAKHGSHGDYEIIALCPSSPRRCLITRSLLSDSARKIPDPGFHPFRRFCGTYAGRGDRRRPARFKGSTGRFRLRVRTTAIKGLSRRGVTPMPIFRKRFQGPRYHSCHDEAGKRNLIDLSSLDLLVGEQQDPETQGRDYDCEGQLRRRRCRPRFLWPGGTGCSGGGPPARQAGLPAGRASGYRMAFPGS